MKEAKRRKRSFESVILATEIAYVVPADEFTLMKQTNLFYDQITKIGQGTFGEVHKCRAKLTNEVVATKKILMENEKEGFPITALREINMLKKLRHRNVTELVDICASSAGKQEKGRTLFYLVFTFCEHDLAGILKSSAAKRMPPVVVKTMLYHLFEGLAYIHSCKVLHRDMKTANILVSKDGVLKLADFGLARLMINTTDQESKCYTNRVVTMWYRPPELLLGERMYNEEIDVWGAGCIMAEFWTRTPILQGTSDLNQLDLIVKLCGSINPLTMKRCDQLPVYKNFVNLNSSRSLVQKLSQYIKDDPAAINLIDRLLVLEPTERLTAIQALRHEYFQINPLPQDNVKDFIATLSGSLFEYTVNQGYNVQRPANNNRLPGGTGAGGPMHNHHHHSRDHRRANPLPPPRCPPNQQVYDRVY
uniref:Protein kinase domain-containing protein n=1 Tax=Panagrolaimus sp. PS1159 TaxID=55785 RepID=A0AC35GEU6_9BILA